MNERITLPMTKSEGMLLWGILDKIAANGVSPSHAEIELNRADATELSWVHDRLAKLCMGTSLAQADRP